MTEEILIITDPIPSHTESLEYIILKNLGTAISSIQVHWSHQ